MLYWSTVPEDVGTAGIKDEVESTLAVGVDRNVH